MNERIRELAKEALDYAEKNQSAEVQQHWFKLYNEKFAQLIVRECANVIADDDLAKDCGTFMKDSWAKGMRYSAHLIKEHFGVEA
jgi:hypothetical protein